MKHTTTTRAAALPAAPMPAVRIPAVRVQAVLAGALLLTGALTLAGAIPAFAHNYLVSSTPTAGETLTELPDEFVITTNDDLLDLGSESGGFALQVTDADGLFYGDGCVTVEGANMSGEVTLGDPGEYTVTWQVISADGHTVSDAYAFTWQPGPDAPHAEGLAEAPVCGQAAPEPTATPQPSATETPTETEDPAVVDEADDSDESAADGSAAGWWITAAIAAAAGIVLVTLLTLRRRRA